MPIYKLKNKDTNEITEVMCSWEELKKMQEENPALETVIGAPKIVSGTGSKPKVDDGFREVMSKVRETYTINNIKDY